MKEILPVIVDTSFNRLAVIDDYISVIWTPRYYTVGDFELCIDIQSEALSLFQRGHYVIRDDDSNNVGIIEKCQIKKGSTDQEVLYVSGRFLPSIIGRRIIAVQTQVSGSVASCIQTLLNQNVINPSIVARKISNVSFNSLLSSSPSMQAQYTGDNLLETISCICETYGVGYRMRLNNGSFIFELYEGTDRSYGQSVNPYVVFSDQYDNLISSDYIENYMDLSTDVLVAGEGEGLDRKTLWVSPDSLTGLNRYEVYKDARNASTNNGEISDTDYYNQLREDGLESITKFTQAFTGNVYFENIEYNRDVFLGDIVTIENTRWGIYINSRLVEIIESIGEDGKYTITPTFGV